MKLNALLTAPPLTEATDEAHAELYKARRALKEAAKYGSNPARATANALEHALTRATNAVHRSDRAAFRRLSPLERALRHAMADHQNGANGDFVEAVMPHLDALIDALPRVTESRLALRESPRAALVNMRNRISSGVRQGLIPVTVGRGLLADLAKVQAELDAGD
jgi:hypothetical protein